MLLKTGAYGLLRFAVPLFPAASATFAPVAMALGVVGILYGAMLAFAQYDMKRLVAYTSVSHLGFVLLGIYAGNALALQGAVMQMLAHGLSTGALFILVGALQERLHTRDMRQLGGLWSNAATYRRGRLVLRDRFSRATRARQFCRRISGSASAPTASPADLRSRERWDWWSSTIYALSFVQRVFHGERPARTVLADFSSRHMLVMATMIIALVWLASIRSQSSIPPVLALPTCGASPQNTCPQSR